MKWKLKLVVVKKGFLQMNKKVQVSKDQEKAQSEKDSQKPRWEKTKLTIRYLYLENTW